MLKTVIFWLEFTLSFWKNTLDQTWKSFNTKFKNLVIRKLRPKIRKLPSNTNFSTFLQISCSNVWLKLLTWFPPVLESPGKSWNLKRVLESPGILLKFCQSTGKSWNFAEILSKHWKSPGIFLWSNSLKERFLSKHHHFFGFLCMLNPAVHWLTALIFMWGILDAIMSIYSQHVTVSWYSNIQICN